MSPRSVAAPGIVFPSSAADPGAGGVAGASFAARDRRHQVRGGFRDAMVHELRVEILAQPDDTTCGPTCLHAVYRYFGDDVSLPDVIRQSSQLESGGTLAVWLGNHALLRGYRATIYTFNLTVFDPTWFPSGGRTVTDANRSPSAKALSRRNQRLVERLQARRIATRSARLGTACHAYQEFLRLGGVILMEDLSAGLIRHYLRRSIPVLTGLSSTYLYRCARERGPEFEPDDVRGEPTGHFVVLCGYDRQQRTVRVADPYRRNPLGTDHYYEVGFDRLVCAILLGVLTYDANLLIIQPQRRDGGSR
jgi:hypothetical protein